MSALLGIPILGALLVIQTAVLSQIPLIHGTADLILLALLAWAFQKRVQTAWIWGIIGGLMVGFASAVPYFVYMGAYLAAVGLALLLRQRIWNVPIFAMFLATFFGTLFLHGMTILILRLMGTPLEIFTSINLIVLPSLLMNLLLALPFYLVFSDLARLLYPESLEI